MRIIAGQFRSRSLVTPRGERTRPTTDRARESLFNVLSNLIDFEDIRVLDLFAGSGALGFEAISRGAANVVFVEKDRHAHEAILANAASLEVGDSIELIRGDVFKSIARLGQAFDLVFADAPYDEARARVELPESLMNSGMIRADSFIVLEHRSSDEILIPEAGKLFRRVEAGEAAFSIIVPKLLEN